MHLTHPTWTNILVCKLVCVSGTSVDEYSWMQPGRYWLFIKRAPTGLLGFAYLIGFAHFHLFAVRNWWSCSFSPFYSNSEYFYFFSATEGIFFFFFRQTMFSPNCQYHKFTILQYTWSKIALTAVWPPFGQPTYILKECCEIFEHHTFELLCCEAESAGLKPLFTPAKNRTVE